jgi:hypothetical protein
MMLSVSKGHTASNSRMIDELERIWKEAVMAYSKHWPGVFLEEQRKTMKIASEDG